MKKVGIVLLLLSSPVQAGWERVTEEKTGTAYADPATMVRSGDTVKMWSLFDYTAFQRMVEVGYFSQKALVEYDCAASNARGLSISLHDEHMGEGKVIYEDTSPHEWEPVSAQTITEALGKVACK